MCTTPDFDAEVAVEAAGCAAVPVLEVEEALLLVVGAVAAVAAADVDAAGLSAVPVVLDEDELLAVAAADGAGDGLLQPWIGISSFCSICSRSSSSTRSGLLLSTISFQPGTSPLPRPNLTATPESVSPG